MQALAWAAPCAQDNQLRRHVVAGDAGHWPNRNDERPFMRTTPTMPV